MRKKLWIVFGLIIITTVLAGLIVWPSGPNIKIGNWYKELKIHRGLDLQGGTHLVYELDTSKLQDKDKQQAAQSVIDVIDRRVNALGLSEPVIQSTNIENTPSVIVELPGVSNVDQAINIIGKTAQLSFWQQNSAASISGSGSEQPQIGWAPTELTGANLKRAEVIYDPNTNDPQVSLEFDDKGRELFAQLTEANIGKPLAIVLDNEMISAPTVQTKIPDGKAVITGKFTLTEAKDLAKLLNAGALPVPIQLAGQENVEASLGAEAVKQSLFAGILGLILVSIYLICYYRILGIVAIAALSVYTLVTMALFKFIPVTLTLAGVAGFILSIGMAVDANVLIFERIKEELREGKTIMAAIDAGFSRAWPSICDSNVSTLITCAVLYYTTTGMVRGFAVTLAVGIIVSLFAAVIVTKNFLQLLLKTKFSNSIN